MGLMKSTKESGWMEVDNKKELIALLEHLEDIDLSQVVILDDFTFPAWFSWVRVTNTSAVTTAAESLKYLFKNPKAIPHCKTKRYYCWGDLKGYERYSIPKPEIPKREITNDAMKKELKAFKETLGSL